MGLEGLKQGVVINFYICFSNWLHLCWSRKCRELLFLLSGCFHGGKFGSGGGGKDQIVVKAVHGGGKCAHGGRGDEASE